MIDTGNAYFCCDECPICVGVDTRLDIADELGCKPQLEYCGCDKIDLPFYIGGYCADALFHKGASESGGRRRTGSAYRRKMRSKKLDRIRRCVDGDYALDIYIADDTNTVYRPKNSKLKKFYKRYSNRLIRSGRLGGSGKGGYRRCFDYKWEIY